jgi:hypothetical protein
MSCHGDEVDIEGTWRLVAWRRIAPVGSVSLPLGPDPEGLLTYTSDGHMSVVMVAPGRPPIAGGDPLGGEIEARAAAYSTCLAYTGTYVRNGGTVVHYVEQRNRVPTRIGRERSNRDPSPITTASWSSPHPHKPACHHRE